MPDRQHLGFQFPVDNQTELRTLPVKTLEQYVFVLTNAKLILNSLYQIVS